MVVQHERFEQPRGCPPCEQQRRPARTPFHRESVHLCGVLASVFYLLSCDGNLTVGSWKCTSAPLFEPPDGSTIPAGRDTRVETGWHSSFEDGFCGYSDARGFCYSDANAKLEIVTAPARTGRRAASFTVDTTSPDARQARCVREGRLPKDAIYGAWFFVPSGHESDGNWNLMHFQGESETNPLEGLLDLSLETTDDGRLIPTLPLYAGDPANNNQPPSTLEEVSLPYDEWFSLDVRLLRDSEGAGIAAVYFNGKLAIERANVVTDRDSVWGQWYVGNLATELNPPQSTIYVDDVSVRDSLDDTF